MKKARPILESRMRLACRRAGLGALAAAAALLAATSFADTLVGTWTLSREGPDGPVTTELTVTEADGGYAGTLTGERGTTELQSIVIDGASFSFMVTFETLLVDIDLSYSGTVSGNTLAATVTTPRGDHPVTGVRRE